MDGGKLMNNMNYVMGSEELDKEFSKEFTIMMRERKALTGAFNLQNLYIPDELYTEVPKTDTIMLRGISTEYYNKLNSSECLRIGRVNLVRRLYNNKGEFKRDNNGNILKEDVDVSRGSIAVLSDINIKVPAAFKADGFNYVDYLERQLKDGRIKRSYIYIIPKRYCYKVNKVALIVANNKQTQTYSGYHVNLQNGYDIYLQAVPFKPNSSKNMGKRVVALKNSTDFDKEMTFLLRSWIARNVIFDPRYFEVEGCKVGNLVFEPISANLEYYEVIDVEHSLENENDLDAERTFFEGGDNAM